MAHVFRTLNFFRQKNALMDSSTNLKSHDLEKINCNEHHYGIVKGLFPWFIILSLFGICVWWFCWPLAAIMSIDSFVV